MFSGGQLYPDLYQYDADYHAKLVQQELKQVLKMDGEVCLLHKSQWEYAIPYDASQAALTDHLRSVGYSKYGLYFSSNYVGGVSLGDCILQGLQTADTISDVQ